MIGARHALRVECGLLNCLSVFTVNPTEEDITNPTPDPDRPPIPCMEPMPEPIVDIEPEPATRPLPQVMPKHIITSEPEPNEESDQVCEPVTTCQWVWLWSMRGWKDHC